MIWITVTVFLVLLSADVPVQVVGEQCAVCTYVYAGEDGLAGIECVNDPFNWVHTRNMTCDFSSGMKCLIKAIYRPNYRIMTSMIRDCQPITGQEGCDDNILSPTCFKYCDTDLCNQGHGDLNGAASLECVAGQYGDGCGQTCGQCSGSPCRHDSGTCEAGCLDGYQGLGCAVKVQVSESGPGVGVVAGAAVAGIVVLVVIAVVIFIIIRRTRLMSDLGARNTKSSSSTPNDIPNTAPAERHPPEIPADQGNLYEVAEDDNRYEVAEDDNRYEVAEDDNRYEVAEDDNRYEVAEDDNRYEVAEDDNRYEVAEEAEGRYVNFYDPLQTPDEEGAAYSKLKVPKKGEVFYENQRHSPREDV